MKELDVTVTYQEYVKIKKVFPYQFWKRFIITSVIIILIFLLALMAPEPSSILDVVLADIIFIIIAFIILKVLDVSLRKFKYKKELRKNPNNMKYTLCFYEDYLEKKSENITERIFYSQIQKKVETVDAIYFMLNSKDILLIKKEDCTSELLDYLDEMNITKKSIQFLKPSNIEDEVIIDKKISKIKSVLMILFIASILSIAGGMLLPQLLTLRDIPSFIVRAFPDATLHLGVVHINFPSVFNISYLWSASFFLPIAILSIILGIIYRKKNFKCTKNIVAGLIAMILLSCMIYFSNQNENDFQIEKNYQEAGAYHVIIGEELPKEGRFFQMIWSDDNTESNYFYFEDKELNEEFKNRIKKSNQWILAKEANTNLSYFMLNSCNSVEEPCYYSVYIDELGTYNEVPTETGLYTIYSMLYDTDIHSIKMQKFLYNYKK